MKVLIIMMLFPSLFSLGNFSHAQTNERKLWIPTKNELKKIKKAIPQKPSVQPKKKRNVLVFSLSWGYVHQSIPFGKKAFELLGKKTGAYNVVVSDDISNFEPENLGKFDAVIFNNTNNEIFLPKNFDSLTSKEKEKAAEYDEKLKESFVNFLKSGKGLAVLHAGVASFRKWEEFGEIIGARFDNHPWKTVNLKLDEPDHPLVQAFKTERFEVTDEIYQVKAPFSRKKLRVLLSIDTQKTDMTVKGVNRKDGDFAISWIKNYGKGRVFYHALGHEKHIYWNPEILKHLLDGIQFVLGDLKCEVAPCLDLKDK